MTGPASPNQEGPSSPPPAPLPEGWLAQWDSQSKKYYFVQRATGHSQWDVPTQPALSVPTPEPTPQGEGMGPFSKPGEHEGTRGDGREGEYAGADRSLLSNLAVNAVMGKHGKQQQQSGLGGLAQSLLGGSGHGSSSGGHGGQSGGGGLAGQLLSSFVGGGEKPHGASSGHGGSNTAASAGAGGIGGALLGSLLGGGNKPQQSQSSSSSQSYGASTSTSGGGHQSSGGGLMGMASGLFGGHGQSVSHSRLRYSSRTNNG
jgi:hypothetical protein